jgi:ferritin-like metal-binding protein YciE
VPKMTEPRALLLHELGDILYAEKVLLKALTKMAKEATDDELKSLLQEHLAETHAQVDRLKEAFQNLGQKATAKKCPGIEGIIAEHDRFMAEHDPSDEMRDLFLTGAGARAEHYEIAAYSGLITMARALGERECVDLLALNLAEEKDALKSLETACRRLSKTAAGAAA